MLYIPFCVDNEFVSIFRMIVSECGCVCMCVLLSEVAGKKWDLVCVRILEP